jgi:hypothetical protein
MAERLAAVEALRNRDLKEFAALLSAKDFEYWSSAALRAQPAAPALGIAPPAHLR